MNTTLPGDEKDFVSTILWGIGALVAGVVWFVRLESKAIYNSRDIERLEKELNEQKKQLSSTEKEIAQQLAQMNNLLARIEERLQLRDNHP